MTLFESMYKRIIGKYKNNYNKKVKAWAIKKIANYNDFIDYCKYNYVAYCPECHKPVTDEYCERCELSFDDWYLHEVVGVNNAYCM